MNQILTYFAPKFDFMEKQEYGKRFYTKCRAFHNENKSEFLKSNPATTHFLFDKGIFKIPDLYMEQFYSVYAESLEIGEKNFIHEQRSDPFFPFYLDLDFLLLSAPTITDYINWTNSIYEIIWKWVQPKKREKYMFCIVAASGATQLTNGQYKAGLHIHFPFLIIDSNYAIDMVGDLKEKLIPAKPDQFVYSWAEKVLDEQVYTTPTGKPRGLRMIGSRKTQDCITCKQKGNHKSCTRCEGTGKMDLGRPYWPIFILSHKNNNIQFRDWKFLDYVRHCSVRCLPEIEIPINNFFKVYRRQRTTTNIIGTTSSAKAQIDDGVLLNSDVDWVDVSEVDKSFIVIHDFFTKQSKNQFSESDKHFYLGKKLEVNLKIKYNTKSNIYCVFTNSRKCPNLVSGEHNNVCIYFIISRSGISIKCLCRCETTTNRVNGSCKNWKGLFFKIPIELSCLFVEKQVGLKFVWKHEYWKDPEKSKLYLSYLSKLFCQEHLELQQLLHKK